MHNIPNPVLWFVDCVAISGIVANLESSLISTASVLTVALLACFGVGFIGLPAKWLPSMDDMYGDIVLALASNFIDSDEEWIE